MKTIETCVYCSKTFNPSKGQGDHIIPVQFGEFEGDVRFRRICLQCNNRIGRAEEQLLRSAPECFFRNIVNPKVPSSRQRGRSLNVGSKDAPPPECKIEMGDHHQLVHLSTDHPENVYPVDQVVIHDSEGNEYFFKLFPGMKPEPLKKRIDSEVKGKIQKTWLHSSQERFDEFQTLLKDIWPKSNMEERPETEAGTHEVRTTVSFRFTSQYFQAIAKMAFHYYLAHSRRNVRGDEPGFSEIRDFIINGGDVDRFFDRPEQTLHTPFQLMKDRFNATPGLRCHVLMADEKSDIVTVLVQLFVGKGFAPHTHRITLGRHGGKLKIPKTVFSHAYFYHEEQDSNKAGWVEEPRILQVR